VKAATAFITS